MGYIWSKKLFIAHVKLQCNWASCVVAGSLSSRPLYRMCPSPGHRVSEEPGKGAEHLMKVPTCPLQEVSSHLKLAWLTYTASSAPEL